MSNPTPPLESPTPRRRRKWPWILLCAVFLLACAVGYVATVMSPDLARGDVLPGVTFTQLEGGDFDLASLRGQVVLLDFWSST